MILNYNYEWHHTIRTLNDEPETVTKCNIFHKNAIFRPSYFANAAIKPAIEHSIPDKRIIIINKRYHLLFGICFRLFSFNFPPLLAFFLTRDLS